MQLTHHYATQLGELATQVTPQPLQNMQLQLVNQQLAEQLQLPADWWQGNNLANALAQPDFELCSQAVAQKYGGHQFGQWNPYLGDGRGLLLGEVTDGQGNSHDLHLKGAGMTPYSRHADGRAVLRSTLREYIGSEALHHLGIPSSRALCLFSSDEPVYRETAEPGAMMIRVAESHIRFGHFEYFFHSGEKRKLEALFEFTLNRYFPSCLQAANPHAMLLRTITLRTARMVALWQAYGFVHGVMNTDNMSIHGITFDYGPYAFMDSFDPSAVFNHSDHQGRYAFDQQPGIALWNLNALAHSFSGHCTTDEIREVLSQYEPVFIEQYQICMLARLGLQQHDSTSLALMQQWLDMVAQEQRDYNHTLRRLALSDPAQSRPALRNDFIDRQRFDNWWQSYRQVRLEQEDSQQQMRNANPAVLPRTHWLQQAIEAATENDFSLCNELLTALRQPFDGQYDDHRFSHPPTDNQPVSLSCSS